MTSDLIPLTSETELDRFVHAFEMGTLTKKQWTHAAHLTIGAYYALSYPELQALTRLRRGIQFLNERQEVPNTATRGYHETLTRFWLAAIRGFLSDYLAAHSGLQCVDAIRAVVETLGSRRDLVQDYYSTDIVASTMARQQWIAPDRRTLPPVVESTLLAFRSNR